MLDPDERQIDLETTEGRRPGGSAGDRLVVGLAAIALLGGALVGISRLLPPPANAEVSKASRTAQPTVAPTATPRPTPTIALEDPLRTIRITEEPIPRDDTPPSYGWGGWARATHRLTVRSSPSTDGIALGTVKAGDAMQIEDADPGLFTDPNWVRMYVPVEGWVQERSGGRANLVRFGDEATPDYAYIDSITAGGQGRYVLTGSNTNDGSLFLAISDDGGHWQPIGGQGMLDGAEFLRIAYGPQGWIAVVRTASGSQWVWQSADGSAWRVLGSLRDLPGNRFGYPQLVGSALGYVLTFPSYDTSNAVPSRVWYSADAQVWSERDSTAPPGEVVAAGIGFYGYQPPNYYPTSGQPYGDGVGVFSPDGWTWSTVSSADMTNLIGVAGASDRLVALDRVGPATRPWVGKVDGGKLAWHEDVGSAAAFDGAVVTAMAGGIAPIAMGYERGSEALLWWSNDPAGWHRHQLPRSFGTFPAIGAANLDSYVLVGSQQSLLGSTPVLWSANGGSTLEPETQPLVAPIRDLSSTECARYSRDLLELMTGRSQIQVHCYGDAPVTLTAWVPRCDGCAGEPDENGSTPAWLMLPRPSRYIHLSPVAQDDVGWFDGILAPGVRARDSWEHHWVRVTGHFDDPAARSCRVSLSLDDEPGYAGRQQTIDGCRELFVVTSVAVLPDGGSLE